MQAQTSPQQMFENLESQIVPKIDAAREQLTNLNERALAFAKERPVTCLVGAVAVGFVIGKLAARL